MTLRELIDLASPPCRECDAPVQRVESRWHEDEDGNWRQRAHMVCGAGHRVVVQPLP